MFAEVYWFPVELDPAMAGFLPALVCPLAATVVEADASE